MTEGWGILELMGHRRLAGIISEETVAGASFIRIDIPAAGEEQAATQFYAPAAVYCITPTDEETARSFAASYRPQPIQRWELKALPAEPSLFGQEVARDEAEDEWFTDV